MPAAAGIKAGKAFVLIEAVDKTARVLSRVGARLKAFETKVTAVGRSLAKLGVISLVPTALSIKLFTTFDDTMKKVEARSGAVGTELVDLREQAKRLGRETSNTAAQIADLQAKLAQKGFRPKQILAMTAAVRDLSRAAGEGNIEDVVVAADLVSGTLRAFRKESTDAENVADVFTAAVNNSNFSLQGLVDAMAKAGPSAARFGVSLEDTVATLAGMTNVNIEAASAGTAFRNFLLKLSDTTKRSAFSKELKKMTGQTIQFVDQMGNLRPLPQLMFELGDATKELGTAQRGKLFSDLFGLRTFVGAATISDGRDQFIEMRDILGKVDGTAKKTAETMESGMGGAFRRFISAVQGAAIEVGEALAPSLIGLTDTIAKNIVSFAEWVSMNRGLILAVTIASTAVVGLGIALIGLGLAIKVVGVALSVFAAALALVKGLLIFLVSPLGLVVAALAIAGIALFKFSETFRSSLEGVGNFLMEKFKAIGETIKTTFGGIVEALQLGDFKAAWEILVTGLKIVWLEFVDVIMTAWERVGDFFVESWVGATQIIKEAFVKLSKSIAEQIFKLADAGNFLGVILAKALGIDVKDLGLENLKAALNVIAADKIETIGAESAARLEKRRRETEKSSRNRQLELAQQRDRLAALAADVRKRAEMEREQALAEAGPKITRPEIPTILPTPQAVIAPGPIRGLERGSVEALEQFQKNAQQQSGELKKIADTNEQAVEMLGDIKDQLTTAPVLNLA